MANYPTPDQNGPQYLKFLKVRKDWSRITLISTYEDQGRDFNTSANDMAQYWELLYDGISEQDAKILDDFWDAHKLHVSFTFIEPRNAPWTDQEGETHTGVRFESYSKDHSKVWVQSRSVSLVKYPS